MTYIEHLDDKFRFGKFKGCSFAEVVEYNPEYILWVVENVRGGDLYITDDALREIRLMFPTFEMNQCFYHNVEIQRNDYDERLSENERMINEFWGNYDDPDLYGMPVTYNRYSGSYAQDVMGYSDDDIDTIFDGDPLAYWNID